MEPAFKVKDSRSKNDAKNDVEEPEGGHVSILYRDFGPRSRR